MNPGRYGEMVIKRIAQPLLLCNGRTVSADVIDKPWPRRSWLGRSPQAVPPEGEMLEERSKITLSWRIEKASELLIGNPDRRCSAGNVTVQGGNRRAGAGKKSAALSQTSTANSPTSSNPMAISISWEYCDQLQKTLLQQKYAQKKKMRSTL
jgi:hypothetical protein